jgi:hypothetical protein
MALTDPKSGVGYLAGERLLSAHVNTVFAQQPRALDAVDGGTYDVGDDIVLNDDGGSLQFGDGLGVEWTGTTNLPALGSRTYSRNQPLALHYRTVGGGGAGVFDWIYSGTGGLEGAISQNWAHTTASETFCYVPLANLIDLATLTQISLAVMPGGHASDPARKIRIGLYKLGATTASLIGSVTEDPATGSAYDTPHVFAVSGYTELIDQNSSAATYYLKILGEGGTNAVNGTRVTRVRCDFTVTKLTPGG